MDVSQILMDAPSKTRRINMSAMGTRYGVQFPKEQGLIQEVTMMDDFAGMGIADTGGLPGFLT